MNSICIEVNLLMGHTGGTYCNPVRLVREFVETDPIMRFRRCLLGRGLYCFYYGGTDILRYN
jgi:hypothetical protein